MSTLQVSAQNQLRQFIEQIERLEEEKKALASDIKDKFLEAKGVGFDVKTMRKLIQLRKMTQSDRQEEEGLLDVYLHALGMLEEALLNDDGNDSPGLQAGNEGTAHTGEEPDALIAAE